MTDTIVKLTDAEPAPELEVIHPAREQGITAGRNAAGSKRQPDEELFTNVVDASLTCVLDEAQAERDRERSGEFLCGFAAGWAEMIMVEPMMFLTRCQTERVLKLPRSIRMAWIAEYRRGCRQWQRKGGAVSGKPPILPMIP